jgi:hypothetical protein
VAEKSVVRAQLGDNSLYEDREWRSTAACCVFAVAHQEYHGWERSNCSAPPSLLVDWMVALTLFTSPYGGFTFRHAAPAPGYLALLLLQLLHLVWAFALRSLPFVFFAWLLLLAVGAAEDFLKSASVDPLAQAAVLAELRRLPRAGGAALPRVARAGGALAALAAAVAAGAVAWRARAPPLPLPPPPPPPRGGGTPAARLLALRWEAWLLLGAGAVLLLARARRAPRGCGARRAAGSAAAAAPPPPPPHAAVAPPQTPAPRAEQGGPGATAAAAARAELFFCIAAAAGLPPSAPAMQAVPARRLLPA